MNACVSVNSFSETRGALQSPPSTIASVKPTRRIQRSNSAEDITPNKNSNKVRPFAGSWENGKQETWQLMFTVFITLTTVNCPMPSA